MTDQHRKVKQQSVYLPEDMLHRLRTEAERLERPLSWVLNRAWRIACPRSQRCRRLAATTESAASAIRSDSSGRRRTRTDRPPPLQCRPLLQPTARPWLVEPGAGDHC